MSRVADLASASGLKPTAAFVLVGAVLLLIGFKAGKIALFDAGEQPKNLVRQKVPEPSFDLVDRSGTPLALSVERLELDMSPNATWQAHTPRRLAESLARALGRKFPSSRLLERMLPDAKQGVVKVGGEAFVLDAARAEAVRRWILSGSVREPELPIRVRGFGIVHGPRAGTFQIAWKPEEALSEESREEHGFAKPLDWTRRIADDLYACLRGRAPREAFASDEEVAAARREIWNALIPCSFKCVVQEIAPESAMAVWTLLREERVRAHQMDLVRVGRRVYPAREGAVDDPPIAVLGRWGTLETPVAREKARKDLGLEADARCTEADLARLAAETEKLVYRPEPRNGIELLARNLLQEPEWADFRGKAQQYTYLSSQAPRQPLSQSFQELVPETETPKVVTTLDLPLQRRMRLELEKVMERHRPALAMGIALEVATGRVLAVDAMDPYGIGGFLPTYHAFTPGSTMKVVVMATALEAGVVTPDTLFDSFDGHMHLPGRTIQEAENQKTGWMSASQGLAYSCNAVLAQIGMRIDPVRFHDTFLDLGYAAYPRSGLGDERKGLVPPLPWKPQWSQASVSFGHELSVTLWQHAAGLATVVRGGEYLPLRLVDAVEQGGVRRELPAPARKRVFSPETCEEVREMMRMGAREGTGKTIYCPYLEMGTKTGTAEKVAGEVCLHAELEHNRKHGCRGARACRRALVGVHDAHRGPCYTSSMCVFGRLPGSEREILVLVVVDEPRGGKKFGADVAGPAALAVLEEALGTRRDGASPPELSPEGFADLAGPALYVRTASAPQRAPTPPTPPTPMGTIATGSARMSPLPWEEGPLAAR